MFEVKSVLLGSAAEKCGIKKGDRIISINGEIFKDYIDYVFFCAQRRLIIKVECEGSVLTYKIIKNVDEGLGLEFAEPLMGRKRTCANRCVFCFVDQLPPGMRKSLYEKDEDWRYSLIMGNYVTLSTIRKEELLRIIKRKASPLYISVHSVDEELRARMLGNDNALPIRPLLKKLKRHGIRFHTQAVICPGMNDGERLEETYMFLKKLYPAAVSLAVVPVGLTAYRKGLSRIEPVSKNDAKDIIKRVEKWQQECLNSINTRFVFAADELYIKAGLPMPCMESYEEFHQIENGVGLISKFIFEAKSGFKEELSGCCRNISIATGEDAYPFFVSLMREAGTDAKVYPVKNKTFGGGVTVSGLLAGRDFLEALEGKNLGEMLLITADALREGEFLDGMKLEELEEALDIRIVPVSGGCEFAELMYGKR